MRNTILILGMTLFLFTSCSNDSEDDVTATTEEETGATTVTYDKDISGLMAASCTRCHGTTLSNGAPFPLTTYDEVNTRSIAIVETIQVLNGRSQMPPSGLLNATDINLVKQWIEDGLLEN